jgi:hypothetical protein
MFIKHQNCLIHWIILAIQWCGTRTKPAKLADLILPHKISETNISAVTFLLSPRTFSSNKRHLGADYEIRKVGKNYHNQPSLIKRQELQCKSYKILLNALNSSQINLLMKGQNSHTISCTSH